MHRGDSRYSRETYAAMRPNSRSALIRSPRGTADAMRVKTEKVVAFSRIVVTLPADTAARNSASSSAVANTTRMYA